MATAQTTTPAPKHPAKYSDKLKDHFRELLKDRKRILDPFGGVGKLALFLGRDCSGEIWINDIEPEWARQAPPWANVTMCDAEDLPFRDGYFDAIATSPTYGNRMADHHDAKDASQRNTYRHKLGRSLHPANTGGMQWGDGYRAKHQAIWREGWRVLSPGGLLVLNISDHVRKGLVVPVTEWHKECLVGLGFALEEHRHINTPRLRFGANGGLRVEHESILVFRKG